MRTSIVPLLCALAACPRGTESDEYPTCEGAPIPIEVDEVTPIGITAAEVIARIPAHEDAAFTYADASMTSLALDFVVGTGATFTDLEAVYPEGSTIDIGIVCDDVVTIPVELAFATEDGVFDEAFAGEATATSEDPGTIRSELDLTAMGGTFSIDEFTDVTDYDDARLFIDVRLQDEAETSGTISGDVSGEDECTGKECSAWDMAVEVGAWGAP